MKRMDVVLVNMVKLMMAGLLMELEIPTEYFTKKNFKFRSPDLVNGFSGVYRAVSDGDVSSWGVIYSYGNKNS